LEGKLYVKAVLSPVIQGIGRFEGGSGRVLEGKIHTPTGCQTPKLLHLYMCTMQPFFLFSTTHCSLLRVIVRSGLDVPTFATRRLHASPRGKWRNGGREMSGKFCLNVDLHITFKALLHAVKLQHGTDGFTFPPFSP